MKYIILLIFAFILSLQFARAQDGPNSWTLTYDNSGRVYGMDINRYNQYIMYECGLDSGVYKSVNGGINWFPANNGLTYKAVFCIAVSPSNPSIIYAGTDQNGSTNSGVYVSTDAGNSWTLQVAGITGEPSISIQQIVISPTNPSVAFITVFDGVNAAVNGVYKTTNMGANWTPSSTGITNKNILSLLINPKNPNVLYAGSSLILPGSTGPSSIFKSVDGGSTWTSISNGLPTGTTTGNPVRCLSISTVDTSIVLAGLFQNDTTGGIFVTTNGGTLWVKKYYSLIATASQLIRSCAIRPGTTNHFYIGLDHSVNATPKGVIRSTDGGNTWSDFNSGAMVNTYPIRALMFKTNLDTTLYAGAANSTEPGRGVFEYTFPQTIPARTWGEQTTGTANSLYSVSAVDDYNAWTCGATGKVYRTSNGGVTWVDKSGNLPTANAFYNIFGWDANIAIAVTSPAAGGTADIWKTSNGGTNWTNVYTYTGSAAFGDALWMSDPFNCFYYGDPQGGNWDLKKSTNGGDNWVTWATVPTTASGGWNNAIYGIGNWMWFGTNSTFIMFSSNAGVNWSQQTTPLTNSYLMWFNNAMTGVAGDNALYSTSNGGTNWAALTSPIAANVGGICGRGSEYWAAPQALTIYYSSNNGANWTLQYTSTTAGVIYHMTHSRNGFTVWGVKSNGTIVRYGPTLTGIEPIGNTSPTSYTLAQNYPNPFNPVTKINFAIPKQNLVTIKVYDILGREVSTLVNEVKSPGTYSIDFDGSKYASGAYFYKIKAGDFTDTKKMMLIK